ncbi:putative RING finger protein P8B7.23 [Gracilariopsis chorda]|uniref:Putative RING finger protein P8B7.23 n=1 Tax=Gracilariopsis chorda TaxID=448386 RepID=A0A2V3J745_9FLOR|nr:putative RING finger protein P8B7.23 [Gracilariopsis chorda]|eukprot:PXF50103.1 putative RING finger protein P8B7.23 [Gracilariopsis chorda]
MSSPDARRRRARKGRALVVPADTLLNFSRYSPPPAERRPLPLRASSSRAAARESPPPQPNNRFAVAPGTLPLSPNNLPWQLVELVFVMGMSQCPICLHSASAACITRCGHVFDRVCMLQHISITSDESGRAKCPLCAKTVTVSDLRAVCFLKPAVMQVGLPCRMTLVSSHKQYLIASRHSAHSLPKTQLPHGVSLDEAFFSRFVVADAVFLQRLVWDDIRALRALAREDESLKAFVNMALDEMHRLNIIFRNRRKLNNEEQQQCAGQGELGSAMWYFYQASDSTNAFLHPVNHRFLNTELQGQFNTGPSEIEGEVVHIERYTMDEKIRKRYRFLSHLADGCEFKFVELNLTHMLSAATIATHAHELKERERMRKRLRAVNAKEERQRVRRESELMREYVKAQGVGTRGGHGELETVDSRDVSSFPALNEGGGGEGTAGSVENECVWGSEVGSYSSVTSNMGMFPSLGQTTVGPGSQGPGSGTGPGSGVSGNAAQGVWAGGSGTQGEETRKGRKWHGKSTIVLSNAGARQRHR